MTEPKNLLMVVVAVAVLGIFGYILALMITPNPYAGTIVAHAESENGKTASQILAMIQGNPGCGKFNIPRSSLLEYDKSQECFMLKTEMHTHRRPTDAALLSNGNAFTTDLSSKLKTCMSPEEQGKLMARIESGKHLKVFLDEIDRSKDSAGKLELINHKMNCSS